MSGFILGSPLHIAILVGLAPIGTAFGRAVRRGRLSRTVIPLLGWSIAAAEAAWYWHLLSNPWPVWPGVMPLHLCDITLWVTVVTAVRRSSTAFGIAYFWGLAGTSMALLTPDVQGLSWSYPTVKFFLSHGLVVVTLLAIAISGDIRIVRTSWRTAFGLLHVYAVIVGVFNLAFGTNYLYLMAKPSGSSVLDLLGPWPWYLVAADAIGAALFVALSLPLKHERLVDPKSDEASLTS